MKAKILVLIATIFCGNFNIFSQCPSSVYSNYKFNEPQGTIAYGSSGTSINLSNTIWVAGKLQGAVSFNGTSSKGILSDNFFNWASNQDFSIEFWFNLRSVKSSNMVFIGRDDPVKSLHWWIGVSSSSLKPTFYLIDNSGKTSSVIANSPIITNTWYHIAVIRNNSTNNNFLYINGQLAGSSLVSYTGDFISSEAVTLGHMKYNGTNSYYSNVDIDELVVHNTAINASDVLSHYTNQSIGNEICPNQIPDNGNEITILPLGNSITYDDKSNDTRPASQRTGYRIYLYNKLHAAGYNTNFVGSEIAGQDLFPDPENGGFPGISKEQMVTLLQTGYNPRTSRQITNGPYLNFYNPDVILLHIGTNGVSTDITAINQILSTINTYRSQSGKNVKLIIARIINRATYDPITAQYNKNLENAIKLFNNSNNYIVDMEIGAGINYATDMSDNLHPNNSGYEKMASLWFSALSGVLDAPTADFVKAPANLYVTTQSNQNVLTWTYKSSNETGFRIERKTESGAFQQIAQVTSGITTFVDNEILSVTNYTYRVNAFSNNAVSVYSNEAFIQSAGGNITNLALGKPVKQSSIQYSAGPTRAIDNNTSGIWNNGSVIHTQNELNPYWQIDLQKVYTINKIEVWNRTDACCISRMANYYVFVSDEPFSSASLNTTISQPGVWNVFYANYPNPSTNINVTRSGRYVRVQLATQASLTMAELKIFGQPLTTPDIPIAPSTLLGQVKSNSEVTLSWSDNSNNEDGFRIERKTESGQYSQIAQLAANTLAFADEGLQASTTYTYRVYAYNSSGSSAYSNEISVQTPAVVSLTNLSLGKPVTQSSTAYGGVPERAIDNNTNGRWSGSSISHTKSDLYAYWQIDLQNIYNINNIEIWNRIDACCIARMSNFHVFVSDVPFSSVNLNTTLSQSGVWNTFTAAYPNLGINLNVNRTGRYARIQLSGTGELNIAEVKIFGNASTSAGATSLKTYSEYSKLDDYLSTETSEKGRIETELKIYPNPSPGEVYIEINLEEKAKGSVSIYNILGVEQKKFSVNEFQAGNNLFTWDGNSQNGSVSAEGIYIVKVVVNDKVYLRKIYKMAAN